MKKISFSEKWGLHQAVLSGSKTMTRRIANTTEPLYKVGEVVAVAQRYSDIYNDECDPRLFPKGAGWANKMFVRADLMPHHIRIKSVRRERLQDITVPDCFKEGICCANDPMYLIPQGYIVCAFPNAPQVYGAPREAFAALIDIISGKGTWANNPEVWVYEFEKVD